MMIVVLVWCDDATANAANDGVVLALALWCYSRARSLLFSALCVWRAIRA